MNDGLIIRIGFFIGFMLILLGGTMWVRQDRISACERSGGIAIVPSIWAKSSWDVKCIHLPEDD